jgi:hypothetical protein
MSLAFQKIKSLQRNSERAGYDFFVTQDIIFERMRRKLVCECEMLRDDEKHRRLELEEMFEYVDRKIETISAKL